MCSCCLGAAQQGVLKNTKQDVYVQMVAKTLRKRVESWSMYDADLKLPSSFEVSDNPKSVVTLTVLSGQDVERCVTLITANQNSWLLHQW